MSGILQASVLKDSASSTSNLTLDASGNVAVGANLTLSGTAARITGDFSNSTIANRVIFQTSTANAATNITAIPNGTATQSNLQLYNGTDTANTGLLSIACSSSEARFNSTIFGTGTYLPITFITGGSERMRIDTSGNVGIGTSSPSQKLDVSGLGRMRFSSGTGAGHWLDTIGNASRFFVGSDATAEAWRVYDSGGGGANRIYLDSSGNVGIGTSSPGVKLDVQAGTNATARVKSTSSGYALFDIDSFTANQPILRYLANGTESARIFSPINEAANQLSFGTGSSGTERMRIDSSGNVLINTTSTMAASLTFPTLVVNSGPFSKGAGAGYFWENRSATATATTNWYGWYTTSGTIYVYNGSANIGSINASTGAYTALSDATKKKDFEPSTLGLSAVLQLKPTLYRMKDADDSIQKELGFIAQEVKDIIPQAYVEQTSLDASGVESTYIGLNDRPIIAALVAAIQELSAKNDALETRLSQLEAK